MCQKTLRSIKLDKVSFTQWDYFRDTDFSSHAYFFYFHSEMGARCLCLFGIKYTKTLVCYTIMFILSRIFRYPLLTSNQIDFTFYWLHMLENG